MAKSTLTQLRLQVLTVPTSAQPAYLAQIAIYENLAADQKQKKDDVKAQAEKDQHTDDALNFRDDQFDLSDASLTQLGWLFG